MRAPERSKSGTYSCADPYRDSGRGNLAEDIEDEFFWNLEVNIPALEHAGFVTSIKRFSQLSWGLEARKVSAQS